VCVCDSIHAVRARVILFCVVVTNLFLFFLNFSLSDSPKSWHPPPLFMQLIGSKKRRLSPKRICVAFFFHFTDFSLEFRGTVAAGYLFLHFLHVVCIYTHTHTHTHARALFILSAFTTEPSCSASACFFFITGREKQALFCARARVEDYYFNEQSSSSFGASADTYHIYTFRV